MTTGATRKVLNYEVSGQGPVIVLLHGYLSSLRYWDDLRSVLEREYTVVTIDLLGFGMSPKPKDSDYDYSEHLEWIERTLEACDVRAPVILFGHSMGALLALRYASKHPENVQRLFLMNTPLFRNALEARRQLAGTNLFFRASLYWGMHRAIVPFMRNKPMKVLARRTLPLKYKGMESYIFLSSQEARARSLRNVIEAQSSLYDLEHLDGVPVTLVQGVKERTTYLKNLLRVTAKPDWQILLTNTGHHTAIENPTFIDDLLRR